MPSIERVAQVAQQEFAAIDALQDRAATHVATMLFMLRLIMDFKVEDEPAMSSVRRERRAQIDATYQRAELAIGLGLGHRRGSMTAAQVKAHTEGLDYRPCTPQGCYEYWMRHEMDVAYAYNYRQRLLPLLFPCERALEFLALVQKKILSAPVRSSPALTLVLPHDATERTAAIVSTSCPLGGRDIDGDRDCFDWEARLLEMQWNNERIEPSCAPLTLDSATTVDAESVTVKYTIGPTYGKQPVKLQLCRAAKRPVTTCTAPVGTVIGQQTLTNASDLTQGPHEVRIATANPLAPDPRNPFVVVIADSAGQTSQTWFRKSVVGVLVHGYAFSKRVAAGKFLDDLPGNVRDFVGWVVTQSGLSDTDAVQFVDQALETMSYAQFVDWAKTHVPAENVAARDRIELLKLLWPREKFVEWAMREIALDDSGVVDWQREMEPSLESTACYDPATFAFDWQFDSAMELRTILKARSGNLHAQVVAVAKQLRAQHTGDVVDFHFIGHSRGTVMISQALLEQQARPDPALAGSYIKLTLLDPHPANNGLSPQESIDDRAVEGTCYLSYKKIQDVLADPLVELPEKVGIREVTVWFQQSTYAAIRNSHFWVPTDDDIACPLNLWGRGSVNDNIVNNSGVRETRHDLTGMQFKDGEVITHSTVVAMYQALIDKEAGGNCVPPPG